MNSSSLLARCRFCVSCLYLLGTHIWLAEVKEVRLVLVEVEYAEETGHTTLLPYEFEESECDVDEDDRSLERERANIPLKREVDQQQAEVDD